MKLPEPNDDPTWSRLRTHDVEELWDFSKAPHVATAYKGRIGLLVGLAEELTGGSGRVLDVGCAQGTLGLTLAERGNWQVDLLDVRPENIAYARARYERGQVGFHVGFLGPDCPPARDYDLVFCTEVLEHVPAPSSLILQLKAKLRPGGALCLTTPNGSYRLAGLPAYSRASQVTIDEAPANSLDGDAHRYLFTREDLIALVRGAGLRLERHGYFSPLWCEGHLKTRYLHRAHYALRKTIANLQTKLPDAVGRQLCSGQYLVARAP